MCGVVVVGIHSVSRHLIWGCLLENCSNTWKVRVMVTICERQIPSNFNLRVQWLDPFDSVLSVALFCKGKFHRFQILRSTMFTNSLTKRIFQGHGMWEALGLLCLPRLVPDKVRHLAPWSPRCFHDLDLKVGFPCVFVGHVIVWLEGMGPALAWVVLDMFHSPESCYFKRYWYCKRSWVGSNKCMT